MYNSEMTPYLGLKYVDDTNSLKMTVKNVKQSDQVWNSAQKVKLLH